MAAGKQLTDWEVEAIRVAYAESGNIAHASRSAGVHYNTALKYLKMNMPALEEMRREKQSDTIALMQLVRRLALEELTSPGRIKNATITELGIISGIMTDKLRLLQGESTSNINLNHTRVGDPKMLTPEERENARKLRDKMLSDGADPRFVDGKVVSVK